MNWPALVIILGMQLPSWCLLAPQGEPETITQTGTALLLPEALDRLDLPADDEPIASQVVLLGEDGTVTPILSNAASRGLFRDERLRGRRTEVTATQHPGLPYLQVVAFRVEEQGELRTPEYHCEVCTIDVRAPQDCPCCQGPMELRFQPSPFDR